MEAVGSCSLRIQVWQRIAEGGPKSERMDEKGDVIRDIVKNVVGGMGVSERTEGHEQAEVRGDIKFIFLTIPPCTKSDIIKMTSGVHENSSE